jgi:hypothetical protein
MQRRVIDALKKKHVVQYENVWQDAHSDFIRNVFPLLPKRRDHDYLKIKLVKSDNPDLPNLLLAMDHGRIVGQLGLIAISIRLNSHVVRAVWGCNLVVLPEYEGSGFGGLLELSALDAYPFMLGFGASDLSIRNQLKRKAKVLSGPFVAHARLEDRCHLIYRSYPWVFPLGVLLSIGSAIFSNFIFYSNQWLFHKDLQVVDDVPTINQVIARGSSGRDNAVIHDLEFCARRITRPVAHGYKKYRLLKNGGSYILLDCTGSSRIADFYFESVAKGLTLLSIARKRFDVHKTAAGTMINNRRDLLPFFLHGFLSGGKRKAVYLNGNCLWDIRRFYLTGLDSDISI